MAIIILLTSCYFLLRTPKVQTYLTQTIASYLSKKLHAKITVGGVNIKFIKKVVLEKVYVEDQHQDTLLYVGELKGDIAAFNTTTQEIYLNKIIVEECKFHLIQYENDSVLNLQFIIDALSSNSNDTTTGKPWKIKCEGIEVIASEFIYKNYISLKEDSTFKYGFLRFENVNTSINQISIVNDTINAHIQEMALVEGGDFFLTHLSTYAKVSPVNIVADRLELTTPFSNIKLNASLNYNGYGALSDFIHSVIIDATFDTSKVYLGDVAHFAPAIKGFDEYGQIAGKIRGTVDKFKAKNLDFRYRTHTHLNGNFSFTGLPDIDETFMEFKIKTLTTTADELRTIPLFPFTKGKNITIPNNIDQMGLILFQGEFTGFYNDFVAYGNFNSALGNVHSDVSLNHNKNNLVKYHGKIETTNFALGTLLGADSLLGKVSINADINGKGLERDDAVVELKGIVNTMEFNKYTYQNVDISGELSRSKFMGAFTLNDPNANIDFSGSIDFSSEIPEFHFSSTLQNVNLVRLNLINRDNSSLLSANLDINFKGNNADNLFGKINLTDITYKEKSEKIYLPSFTLTSVEEAGEKKINIRSEMFNADINGIFTFVGIKSTGKYFLTPYLPTIAAKLPSIENTSNQTFKYKIWFGEKITAFSKIFTPDVSIHPQTTLNGSYTSSNRALAMNIISPEVSVFGNKMSKVNIWSVTYNDTLRFNLTLDRLSFTKDIGLQNVNIQTTAKKDSIGYSISWDNKKDTLYKGQLEGLITLDSIRVNLNTSPSTIVIADSVWTINNFLASIDSNRIVVDNLKFYKNEEIAQFNGILSDNHDEAGILTLSNFDIQNVNFLLGKDGVKLKGKVNGLTSVQSALGRPDISSSIVVKDFTVDNDNLGDIQLRTNWDNENKIIGIDGDLSRGSIKAFAINGKYFVARKDNYLDFAISLNKFKLDYLSRFTTDIFSDIKGRASGELKLTGDFDKPELNGKLQLQKTSFRVDYTNEIYSLSDSVSFFKDAIVLDSIRINDSNGNSAVASGEITHNYFRDFAFNLHFVLNNFECLNTTYALNNSFYGTAFASGIMDITGTPENLVFDVKAKIDKGVKNKTTKIAVPIEDKEEIEESNFVTFINKTNKAAIQEYKVDLSGLQLNFDLEVNPDAQVQIIFDASTGDIITATGSGKIKMEINTLGDFNMYGDYVIEDGSYKLTLKEVISRDFKIEKGGNITWNGDPYEALMDITAIYRLRASLYDLNQVEFETKTEKIPINCNLMLQGKLLNPNITFGIDFPGLEEDIKSRAMSYLATEQAINKHVFSLLAFGQFLPENIGASYATGAATTTSTDIVSKNVSSILSSALSGVVEGLDVNYSAGNENKVGELRVAFSRQLLNDRVSIQVNGGNANTISSSGASTNKIVGDFTGEIKITKDGRFKGKVYNKSEDQDLLYGNTSYTQGIGLFYRKEFDSLSELFKKSATKQ